MFCVSNITKWSLPKDFGMASGELQLYFEMYTPSLVLMPESSLCPGARHCPLQELLLSVEEDGLVAGDNVLSLPEQSAHWLLMERDH